MIGGAEANVLRAPNVTAFVGSRWWLRNEGSVIVIPCPHFESIFDLLAEAVARIHSVAQRMSVATTSVYRCKGVSARQHKRPSVHREVWPCYLNVLSRRRKDRVYERTPERSLALPHERIHFVAMPRATLHPHLA